VIWITIPAVAKISPNDPAVKATTGMLCSVEDAFSNAVVTEVVQTKKVDRSKLQEADPQIQCEAMRGYAETVKLPTGRLWHDEHQIL